MAPRLPTILRSLMEEKGWGQSEVAMRAGVDQSVISRILSREGYRPRPGTIQKLAAALEVTAQQLAGDEPIALDVGGLAGRVLNIRVQTGGVPLVSPKSVIEQHGIINYGALPTDTKWVPCPTPHSNHAFAILIDVGAMEPEYRDSEMLFVDPGIPPRHGKDIVLIDDRKLLLRRYIVTEGGAFIKPLNRRWPDQIRAYTENMVFCGTVFFSGLIRYLP